MRDAGGEQVGRGMSPGRDLSRVHSATLLGMLQSVVHEVVATSQGESARELCSMLVRLALKVWLPVLIALCVDIKNYYVQCIISPQCPPLIINLL